MNLTSQYIMQNISPLSNRNAYLVVVVVMGFVGFTVSAVEMAMLSAVIWNLLDREIPGWFKKSYGVMCAGWAIAFGLGVFFFLVSNERHFLLRVHIFIVLNLYFLSFLYALLLLVMAKCIAVHRKRASVRRFGWFLMAMFIASLGGFFLPDKTAIFLNIFSDLVLNLCLALLLKPFLKSYFGELTSLLDHKAYLDDLAKFYRISDRERDIVELILKGMSNKEIEQGLFISPHTVKNHIYNIFQKTGVKSRGQLTNLVLRTRDTQSA
jgi:DNA-binding CsgD family transcriptional regulator